MHVRDGGNKRQVLLATAIIRVRDTFGQWKLCRALLDPGTQASFITEVCVQRLQISRKHISTKITGLAETSIENARGIVEIQCGSFVHLTETFTLHPLVLPKVTEKLPTYKCTKDWPHFENLKLADPNFYQPRPAEIVIGAELAFHLLLGGRRHGAPDSPLAIESKLGWLVSGNCSSELNTTKQVQTHNCQVDVGELLQNFWELEEIPDIIPLTKEEKACESHFAQHHARMENGQYIVKLPFREDAPPLENSYTTALRRFKQVEKKLSQNPTKYQQYRDFMKDYIQLGHMTQIDPTNLEAQESYYLPHHAVLKEDSTTTKLRVVFDASAKSSSGISLNDRLMVGPKTQDDLAVILLRFRSHPIALSADIEKMYRQINVPLPDSNFQLILWRNQPDQPLHTYRSNVITYGTGSASFGATRVVKQLAQDERLNFPEASVVAQRDLYMDDLLSGLQSIQQAIEQQAQLIAMFKRGGFCMRKWASNAPELLFTLPLELRVFSLKPRSR